MMVPTVDVPAGYKFSPKDEELIEHYLGPKVRGEQKFHLSLIPELDVYATEPWNLGIEFGHGRNRDSFFCFTQVTRSGASNGRLLRRAGNGTWHASGQTTLIRSNGEVAGQKMANLKFMLRAKKGDKPVATSWIMHEYRLVDLPVDNQGREMVLYRILKSRMGLSDDHQLSCLDDFPASTANQQLRKRKRDQMHCCEIAAGTTTSCSKPAPPPSIAVDGQPESTSMSGWVDSVEISVGSVFQPQPMTQLPCSSDDAAPLFCSEMAAGYPILTTMTSCSTPPPRIASDEQLQGSTMSIWEDPVDFSGGSVFQSQSMMQLPCSSDDAVSPFCSEIATGYPAMTTMMSCSTSSPSIIDDEQRESKRIDDAIRFVTSTMSVWEDLVHVSKELDMQSHPMMQPLSSDDDHAQQQERIMVESATGSRTNSTFLCESDWDEADFRKILEMVEKIVS